MTEVIAWIVLFMLWGCEMKVEYKIDGQLHSFELNPAKGEKQ